MIRRIFIVLLSVAYLGLALGGASPMVYCTAGAELCPTALAEPSCEGAAKDCCSHGNEENEEPGCCFAVMEKGDGWVLPDGVKAPECRPFECHRICAPPLPGQTTPDVLRPSFPSPDPPGPSGRSLLIRVSRQLV